MDAGRGASCPARPRAGYPYLVVVRRRADTDRECHVSLLLAPERVPHYDRFPTTSLVADFSRRKSVSLRRSCLSTLSQDNQRLPRIFLFAGEDFPARGPIQRIARPASQYCSPIGVTAHILKEKDGALDEPKPGAGQTLGNVPMHAAHERAHAAGVIRKRSWPAGAKYR